MYPSPDNLDFDPNNNLDDHNSPQELLDQHNNDVLSKKQILQRKKHLEKLFVYLIGFGVGVGLMLALIVTMALSKFGLLEKPNEIESEPQKTESLELKIREN